jgi:hypothetical protein
LTADRRRPRISDVRFVPLLAALALAAGAAPAAAAPAVDAVVVWAPGLERAPLVDVARARGVGVIDRSPPPAPAPGHRAAGGPGDRGLRRAGARRRLATLGARGPRSTPPAMVISGPTALAVLFMYRALVRTQRGDASGAWDEWSSAAVIAPERTLDPARFAPRAVADLDRARAAVAARARVALEITDAVGCQLVLDGAATAATASVLMGNHWLRVSCPGAEPWGMRLAVSAASATVSVAARRSLAPADDELLVVARGVGAHEFVTVVARGDLVWIRRIGGDGRERDRRTVAVGDGGAVIADAVAALMRPAAARVPWYRTRWAWAAGIAGATAAIAIPLTLIIAGGDAPTTATVVGPGGRL